MKETTSKCTLPKSKSPLKDLLPAAKLWAKSLSVATIIIIISMLVYERGSYIPALFIGYFAAVIYFFTLIGRTLRIMSFSSGAARREMLIGFLLRFIALAVIFAAAAKISTQLFIVTVFGFFVAYVLGMLSLIISNKFDEK